MADPAEGPRADGGGVARGTNRPGPGLVRRRRKPQGRRSRLIIRRVDPWTVLKFSALLYVSTYFVVLVAGVVLWAIADASGVRGNIESFVSELIASESFEFKADQIMRASVFGGGLLVIVGTFANVLMAVLFNLISDVVGGIGIAVEERPPRMRRRAKTQAKARARAETDAQARPNANANPNANARPKAKAKVKAQRPPAPAPKDGRAASQDDARRLRLPARKGKIS